MKQLLTIALIIFSNTIFSQYYPIVWQDCYGGSNGDAGIDVVSLVNKDLMIFCGTSSNDGDVSFNYGGSDFWLVNTDSLGNIKWEKSYGGSDDESKTNMLRTEDNCYLMFGYTLSNNGIVYGNHGSQDYWIVKVDSIGELIWQKCLGGSWPEFGMDMKIDLMGNIILMGYSFSDDGNVSSHIGHYDYWIVKLNQQGELIWEKSLGGTDLDLGLCIFPTEDYGYIAGGLTMSTDVDVNCELHSEYYHDAWIVKLDSSGNIQWQRCLGGSFGDNASEIIQTVDGGYLFAGITNSNDGDVSGFHGTPGTLYNDDIWVVKLDETGNIEWQCCLGGTDIDEPEFIKALTNGNYLIGGSSASIDGDITFNNSWLGYRDAWLIELSPEGEIIWQKCYGGSKSEIAKGASIISNEIVVASGTLIGGGDVDCELHGSGDVWMFKISDTTTGVNELQSTDEMVKFYPNPARDYVVFELPSSVIPNRGVSKSAGVRNPPAIRIINIFGRMVVELPIKTEKTVWDTREVQSGIYFYKIEINGKLHSGKIVVQK